LPALSGESALNLVVVSGFVGMMDDVLPLLIVDFTSTAFTVGGPPLSSY
jgi:hypothetical protein